MSGQRMILLMATGNAGKVKEITLELERAGLAYEVRGLRDLPGVEECVEDRDTFVGNACKKARHYAQAAAERWGSGAAVLALADDSGLCVDALGGAPGVFSARYAGVSGHGADAANNAKLLEALRDVPDEKRGARFVCAAALATANADLAVFVEEMHGRMLHGPRGDNGFGYDPLFLLPGKSKTTAELSMNEKSALSHRGKAIRCLIAWMKQHAPQLSVVPGAVDGTAQTGL